jgi:hypothetical protein
MLVDEIAGVIQKSPTEMEIENCSLVGSNTQAKAKLGYTETSLHKAIEISFENFK